MLYKIIILFIVLYDIIYTASYAMWEKKQKNIKGFVGIGILMSALLCLFLTYFVA